ncbi:hypothetical protein ACQCQ7_16025, partial [Ralstonia pseudosolanacearum]
MPLWSALSRALPGLRFARERVQRFLSRPRRPRDGAIRLDRRHVYILPTATGAGFALLLVAMLLTSLNYNVSLGFLLTFLLAVGVLNSAVPFCLLAYAELTLTA